MSKDFFADKAGSYDQNKRRVDTVESIANAVISNTRLESAMHLMDFGSGTGLLLERVAPYVNKITAVDVSNSMIKQLEAKRSELKCKLDILAVDLEKSHIDARFDGIISSMTMHHIQNVSAVLEKFHGMLNEDGFIAIADLDLEDGSFHSEDTGVHHPGFDRDAFADVVRSLGFSAVQVTDAGVIHKEHGEFSVFLLTAKR